MPQQSNIFPLCIFKGPQSEAAVLSRSDVQFELHDLGLLRAYAVFDYLRTYGGKPFRQQDYFDRLARSSALLGMDLPISHAALSALVESLISATDELSGRKQPRAEYGLRFLLTGGPSLDGFSRSFESTLIVLIEPVWPINPRDSEAGIKLIRCEYLRDLPEAKTTNYVNAMRLYPMMVREGASEILYCWQGETLEASRSNIFAFFGNTLVTPVRNILLGNTRKVVLEIAAGRFEVEERVLRTEELNTADELFITGSGRMVTPVVQLDQMKVGNGMPGLNTKTIIELFEKQIHNSN